MSPRVVPGMRIQQLEPNSSRPAGTVMIETVLRFVLSNYTLTFLVIGLCAAGISLARQQKPIGNERIFDTLLAYFCLISIGIYFCYNFVMHVFFGEVAAEFIGWADSPFQFEVGTASLGFGVVGLLAFRSDMGLRLAAVTGPAMFMWGAAVGHIQQMITERNFAPGNAGVTFWMDIILPVVGYALLYGWHRAKRESSDRFHSSGSDPATGS
jgi:hypothetical protein